MIRALTPTIDVAQERAFYERILLDEEVARRMDWNRRADAKVRAHYERTARPLPTRTTTSGASASGGFSEDEGK